VSGVKGAVERFRSSPLVGLAVYLVVGGVAFVVDLGLLILGRDVLGWPLGVAGAVAFWAGLAVSYLMQRFLTFRSHRSSWHSLWKYGTLVLVNSAATIVIIELFDRLGPGYVVGKFVATALTTVWNYAAYKYWVFASDRLAEPGSGTEGTEPRRVDGA
jgi:putative flippase GtrA